MATIIGFVLVLSLLILVHELGHFFAARISNIKVEEFGIGLPPKIFTFWKTKETEYTLNLLPIGGFVRLHGETINNPEDSSIDQKRSFYHKNNFIKSVVLLAGVFMNFAFALLLTGIVIAGLGRPLIETSLYIESVSKNSPAFGTQITKGDQILKYRVPISNADFQPVSSSDDLIKFINDNKGQEIELLFQKENQEQYKASVVPRSTPPEGEGPLGISFVSIASMDYYPVEWHKVPYYSVTETFNLMQQMILGLGSMASDLVTKGTIPQDIAGPVGIAKITGQVAQQGFYQLVQFTAIVSLNLSIINILPFPALDGGRLLFVAIESVTRRKINPRYETYIHAAGMIVLLTLVLILSIYDVQRFF